jgi:hypothetical protein
MGYVSWSSFSAESLDGIFTCTSWYLNNMIHDTIRFEVLTAVNVDAFRPRTWNCAVNVTEEKQNFMLAFRRHL